MSTNDKKDIDVFVEHGLRLAQTPFNGVGTNLAGIGGGVSMGRQVGEDLRAALIEFKKCYLLKDNASSLKLAADIEGYIEVSRTLDNVTDEESDSLLSELDKLMEGK